MTYKNNFVCAIKVNGKVLRETGDLVTLPIGSEYSIYLKNLSSVRALVKVSVDGTDATEDVQLIVPANGSVELERFIRKGNQDKGNRFKFIERTAGVEAHRGIGAEDGLVRVEYWMERVVVQKPQTTYWNLNNWNSPTFFEGGTFADECNATPKGRITQKSTQKSTPSASSRSSFSKGSPVRSMNVQNNSQSNYSYEFPVDSVSDAGITVAGSESDQRFTTGAWFPTELTSSVLVLRLRGAVANNQPVSRPVFVSTRATCTSCGLLNRSINKFCGACGTSLVII